MKPYPSYKPSGVQWLGNVPGHWQVIPLRYLSRGVKTGGTPVQEAFVDKQSEWAVPWYAPADLRDFFLTDSSRIVATEHRSDIDVFAPGTIALVGIGDVGRVAILTVEGTGNQQLNFIRPVDGVASNFLTYALMAGQEFVRSRANVTLIPILNQENTKRLRFAVPPPDEQQAIAGYLDVENSRIDTLIREKDELIGLLQEWRHSVIAEYTSGVTQPQDKKATSNVHVPWIPLDWSMVRLGKYARIGNGSTPLKDNASYWEDGTFPWLNSAVVNRDVVDEGSEYVTDVALRACHLPIVEPGAVLVALTGQGKTRGRVTVLRIQATINQHLAYLALDETRFDSNFVFWSLTGMYAALRMVSDGQGGTKGALTCDDLARFEVPMPLLHVQQEIAKAISSETAKIDDLIAHTNDEITLLKELRAATISDAVLGRIDVRTATLQ